MNSMARKFGALVAAGAIVGFSASPAAATHDATGEGASAAVTGTGLFEILDTGFCEVIDTNTAAAGVETAGSNCGAGLDSNQIDAFTQTATAPGDGTSTANAGVAPINLTDPAFALDLTDLGLSLAENTVDNIVGGLAGPLGEILGALEAVTGALDTVLAPVLDAVAGTIPLSVIIGAVEAECSAAPGTATGSSHVAGLSIDLDLTGLSPALGHVTVPIELATTPNSPLLVSAPRQLVDGILAGLTTTLTTSINGQLGILAPVLTDVVTPLVDQLLVALEPSLLQQLNDLLEPIITGTVNVQDTSRGPGTIDIVALELILLGTNVLDLAAVSCGPNTAGTPHTATPPATSTPPPAVPVTVAAGEGGMFAGLGSLAAVAVIGTALGVAGHRLRRSLI